MIDIGLYELKRYPEIFLLVSNRQELIAVDLKCSISTREAVEGVNKISNMDGSISKCKLSALAPKRLLVNKVSQFRNLLNHGITNAEATCSYLLFLLANINKIF